jgi:hypothetical protein
VRRTHRWQELDSIRLGDVIMYSPPA